MRRLMLRNWLGGSVCAAVLMAGCNQAQRQPAYSTRPMSSVAMLPGYTPGTVFTTTAAPATQAPKTSMASSMPAPAPVSADTNVASDKDNRVTEMLPPAPSAAAPVKEVETIPTVTKSADSEMTPAGYAVPVTGGKEETFHRRSYADITAKACFAHAPDYSWVQGELVHLHSHNNSWRIRYASVDEDDKYGGGVNLIETGPMENFREGQLVRIEGRPADPENKDTEYRVNSIHVLPNE
jgi:hypothetical protein